jgi:hypothetical protein
MGKRVETKERWGLKVFNVILIVFVATLVVLGTLWIWQKFIAPQGEVVPLPTPTATKTEALGTLPISWKVNSIWKYDESDIDSWGSMKVYYGDWKYLATLTDDNVSSLTLPAGVRKVKLVIDYGSNTVGFVDKEKQLTEPYFVGFGVKDVDNDGTDELYFDVDFSGVGELKAGESEKSVTNNLWLVKYDSSLDITATVNATGCNTAGDKYAEGYVSGWDGYGYAFKVVYIKVTLPNSDNATYADPSNS